MNRENQQKTRNDTLSALTSRAKEEHRHLSKNPGFSKLQQQAVEKLKAADLKLTVNIPQFIIDNYQSQMSATAWKFFTYLCRCATFDPKHIHFGTCILTHEKISEATGIKKSNMRKYEAELVDLGLLRVRVTQQREGGGFHTIHYYEVTFFKIREDQLR
jgi:hypothetical protein